MLTIQYPQVVPIVEELSLGLWPISFRDESRPNLIVKTNKEMLLAAKINGGFKIYVIPITLSEKPTIGLISAFFDDEDEPLVIFTPLFQEDKGEGSLTGTIGQHSIDIHFFDEHSRELLGYTCKLDIPVETQKRLLSALLIPYELDLARSAQQQLATWFGLRSELDDLEAMSVSFVESLIPDDLVILDARPESHPYQGSASFSFSSLEREEPGAFQERDIARLLGRLFDPAHIFMNPLRVSDSEEIADIMLISEEEILVLQAKDSPNTKAVIQNTIQRKKLTAQKSLTKAISQTSGALRYLRSVSPVRMIVDGKIREFDISNHRLRALIVVKELFNDEYSVYSPPILKLARETKVPCIALDYGELQAYTRLRTQAKFFEAFDRVFQTGVERDEFPRLRIWID